MTDTYALSPLKPATDQDDYLQGMDKLTLKQRAWISALFGPAHLNATEAARLAGYECTNPDSYEVIGCQNLSKLKPFIQALAHAYLLDPIRTAVRMSEIATTSADDVLDVDPETGQATINLEKARQRGRLHTVKRLRKTKEGWDIEMHDPMPALHDLAAIHRLFPERNPPQTSVTVNVGPSGKTVEELEAELKALEKEAEERFLAKLRAKAMDVQPVDPAPEDT